MSVATVTYGAPEVTAMIQELLRSGTLMGYTTLAQIREKKVGLSVFAQETSINPDFRLRQLAGISLSLGITLEELTQRKHDELVTRLQRCIAGHPAIAFHTPDAPALLNEIREWTP